MYMRDALLLIQMGHIVQTSDSSKPPLSSLSNIMMN